MVQVISKVYGRGGGRREIPGAQISQQIQVFFSLDVKSHNMRSTLFMKQDQSSQMDHEKNDWTQKSNKTTTTLISTQWKNKAVHIVN